MPSFSTDVFARHGEVWVGTIRAIHRQELGREPTDNELVAHLTWIFSGRDGGWTAEKMFAFVHSLEEYRVRNKLPDPTIPPPPAKEPFPGRARVDGRFMANDRGTFRPIFVSALALPYLVSTGNETKALAYMDWAKKTGFNGLRVFAGMLRFAFNDTSRNFSQTAEQARKALPRVMQLAKDRNLYVEVTAITGSKEGGFDPEKHVREIATNIGGFENLLFEVANEPYHSSQSDAVHKASNLLKWGNLLPSFVPFALGAANGDETPEMAGGKYVTVHLDRSRDKWNMVRRVRELEALSSKTGKFVMNNEPVGWDEKPNGSKRLNDPNVFFVMGALNRVFEIGGVGHGEHALTCDLPGPVAQTCAKAFVEGSLISPFEDRFDFKNSGWSDSPVDEADFDKVVRIYHGICGRHGIQVQVGLTGDPKIEWKNGWYAKQTLAYAETFKVLEIAR